MKHFDLIIIGGGGGLKLVGPARKAGKQVAVIEKDALGGTCLNRGCIPSKMLIYPAEVARTIKDAGRYDIEASFTKTHFKKLSDHIQSTVKGDSQSVVTKYEQDPGITFYHDEARFVGDRVLKVGNEEITAERIVLATGARPKIPPIPGLEGTPYMTSTEALYRKQLPKKLIVIGGGYIGVELGHAYGALGSEVHFLVRGRMIGREDAEVIDEFEQAFAEHHVLHQGVSTDSVAYDDKRREFKVTYSTSAGDQETLCGDALLVATGVTPNTDSLGLEETSIKPDKQGFIPVNEFLETETRGVYAIGDCIGHYLFRHSVNYEGEYLAQQFFSEEESKPITYPPMPHAIFSEPQVAGVGRTEEALKEAGVSYVVGKNRLEDSAYGMALRNPAGFVKLLFDAENRQLLGAHIIGYQASVMIHQLIAVMTLQGGLDELLKMIYIHPALSENVRNAARNADKAFRHMR